MTAPREHAELDARNAAVIWLYQRAANWSYVGRTGPYPKWVDPTSGRQVAAKATKNRTKAQMEQLAYQRVGSFHKHKFVLHLGSKP